MDDKSGIRIMSDFHKKNHLYSDFSKEMETLIKTLLKVENFNFHSVTSRTKSEGSLERKIGIKQNKYRQLSDITDISGVRVITFFSDDVDTVARIISENFKIVPELSVDKRKILDHDRFGYLSLHYVVELTDERILLRENHHFKDLRCEIQIRSILQHAWAEIEHDLGYKSINAIPRDIRRKFSRQASLLELADEEFVNIREKINDYSKNIKEILPHSYENIIIDRISLENYILISDVISRIDLILSKIIRYPLSEKTDSTQIDTDIEMLKFVNITTISDLDRIIKENENLFPYFAWTWINEEDPDSLKIEKIVQNDYIVKNWRQGKISRGISIFYLVYILLGQKEDKKTAAQYLSKFHIGESSEMDPDSPEFDEETEFDINEDSINDNQSTIVKQIIVTYA